MASAAEEIAIKLGVKTGDLKAALTDAGVSIKKLKTESADGGDGFAKSFGKAKQSIEIFKSVLAGAGLVGIIKNIFSTAVEYAEKYTGAFDENVAATLRLRDAQKDLESIVGKVAVGVVGFADKLGTAVGALVYGVDAASDAVVKFNAEAKKAFDDAQAKKLLEATAKLTQARRDAALAAATDDGKINILAGEYVKLLDEQSKLKKGSIEWIEKATQAEAKGAELRKQDADVRKKEDDDRKKAAEDQKKIEDDINSRRTLAAKDELELFELQRKNVATLTAADKQRLALLEAQKIQQIGQVEIEDLLKKKLTDGLLPEEAKRLDELLKQDKKLAEQIEKKKTLATTTKEEQLPAEEAVTSEMERQAAIAAEEEERKKRNAASNHVGVEQQGDVRSLSNTKLDQVVIDLNRQIAQLKATAGPLPLGYTPPEILILMNALDNAKKEQSDRLKFDRTQKFFGTEQAERLFSPDEFARFSQLFNPDQMKKDSTNLASIASGLATLFPDKFQGSIR